MRRAAYSAGLLAPPPARPRVNAVGSVFKRGTPSAHQNVPHTNDDDIHWKTNSYKCRGTQFWRSNAKNYGKQGNTMCDKVRIERWRRT